MQVYLSGSIRGGREFQSIYKLILEHLRSKNLTVLTHHVAEENILELEDSMSDKDIFRQDIKWLDECDVLVAEISTPSLGVGYEIAYALRSNKPVLAVYSENKAPISAMIKGNTAPTLIVQSYKEVNDLLNQLDTFFQNIG